MTTKQLLCKRLKSIFLLVALGFTIFILSGCVNTSERKIVLQTIAISPDDTLIALSAYQSSSGKQFLFLSKSGGPFELIFVDKGIGIDPRYLVGLSPRFSTDGSYLYISLDEGELFQPVPTLYKISTQNPRIIVKITSSYAGQGGVNLNGPLTVDGNFIYSIISRPSENIGMGYEIYVVPINISSEEYTETDQDERQVLRVNPRFKRLTNLDNLNLSVSAIDELSLSEDENTLVFIIDDELTSFNSNLGILNTDNFKLDIINVNDNHSLISDPEISSDGSLIIFVKDGRIFQYDAITDTTTPVSPEDKSFLASSPALFHKEKKLLFLAKSNTNPESEDSLNYDEMWETRLDGSNLNRIPINFKKQNYRN